MNTLSVIAAFALTMIALATVVSALVEIYIRWTYRRPAFLADAMRTYLGKVLVPRVYGRDNTPGLVTPPKDPAFDPRSSTGIESLVDRFTLNPLLADLERIRAARLIPQRFYMDTHRVDALSPLAFLQRLAKSAPGQAMATEVDDATLAGVLTDLVRTFERYAAASAERFRKYAHCVAMITAMLLAFVVNVDAPRIYELLAKNDPLREQLLAQAPQILEEYRKSIESLEEQSKAAATPAQRDEVDQALATAKADFEEIQAQMTRIGELGLPIGLNCERPGWRGYAECFVGDEKGEYRVAAVLGTILGGILIGLGGPFWFRVFQSVSQFLPSLAGVTGTKEMIGSPTEDVTNLGGQMDYDKIVEVFRVAAGISAPTPKTVGAPAQPTP